MIDDGSADGLRMEADEAPSEASDIRFRWGLPYLLVGESRYVDAVVRDSLGRELDDLPIEFLSADPTMIEVAASGAVTGLEPGDVEVVARFADLETRLLVGVESSDARWLELSDRQLVINWLQDATVSATAFNENDRMLSTTVTWSSNDLDVATVDEGHIQAVGPGSTQIVATSADARAVVYLEVVAPPAASIDVVAAPRYLDIGESDVIDVVVRAADGRAIENAEVVFESLQPGVVWVEESTGRVKALADGLAKIAIRSGGARSSYQISVRQPPPN